MAGDALPVLPSSRRIVDTVQAALRSAIFDGALRAGQALSVPELARQLNVSRSPVREAVLGLAAQGLAVEQPRRGVVVATVDPAALLAIHEVRIFLEAGATSLCAQRSPHQRHRRAPSLRDRVVFAPCSRSAKPEG